MAQYSIKDLEKLSGIKAHTLRIWEQRYKLLTPGRTTTNIRYYNSGELKRILNIALLNRHGMKISNLAKLTDTELQQQLRTLSNQEPKANDLIDELQKAVLEMDESAFEKMLSLSLTKMGFEESFTTVVFPFLERCAILWSTGTINSAQEIFIRNLIRRKLCVAIDHLYQNISVDSKKWLLFLPEGECHDLQLLFMEYLLRKKGQRVYNVGDGLLADNCHRTEELIRPDFLLTILTTPMHTTCLEELFKTLNARFPQAQLLVGGARVNDCSDKMPTRAHAFKQPGEVFDLTQC
ncbi:MAG: MerR family transcriptional regulator [Chitinophagales bacterium]